MEFASLTFLSVFLPVAFAAVSLARGLAAKNVALLLFSLLFYAYAAPAGVAVLFGVGVATWALGNAVVARDRSRRPAVLVLALVLLVAALFVARAPQALFGSLAAPLGVTPRALVGASFIFFQAASYVLDVYLGEIDADPSLFNVLLYLCFFPQLICGPIVRYRDFSAQLYFRAQDPAEIAQGFRRFVFGLAKKVLLAQQIAVLPQHLFAASAESLFAGSAWVAALSYGLAFYLSFSAYADMTVGLGLVFGFELPENFDHPYAAGSMQGFWQRFNIGLHDWLRDFVYIPIGGSEEGRGRQFLAVVASFAAGSLFYGIGANVAVWAAMMAAVLFIELAFPALGDVPRAVRTPFVLLALTIGWVFFATGSLSQATDLVARMFTDFSPNTQQLQAFFMELTPAFVIASIVGVISCAPVVRVLESGFANGALEHVAQLVGYALALVCLAVCIAELASTGSIGAFVAGIA